MFFKLAWRNTFKNKKRTIIAGTAIGLGIAFMMFYDGMMEGMTDNMYSAATELFTGHAQIHNAKFRESYDAEYTVENYRDVVSRLESDPVVKDFTERTMTYGMITSSSNVNSVTVVGIVPETERNVSKIDDAITEGSFFEGKDKRPIVIGAKLAELLDVKLGDRIVVTCTDAHTGDLAQEMFRISGIYDIGDRTFNSMFAFIPIEKAQSMLGIGDNIHEIAIEFDNYSYALNDSIPFWNEFSQGQNKAISWTVIMSSLMSAMSMADLGLAVVGGILFVLIALLVWNTLFMSLYERIYEFGVLKALGTRPFNLAKLMMFEAISLGFVSMIIGIIIGILLFVLTNITGLNFGGTEFAGVTIREPVYPVMHLYQFIIYPLLVLLGTIIISIYPAVYTARLNASEALRRGF